MATTSVLVLLNNIMLTGTVYAFEKTIKLMEHSSILPVQTLHIHVHTDIDKHFMT